MDSQNLFTCVTCNVAFKESDTQRAHYKTDWHRYNLKRKIADLAPVTAQQFAERVQLQKSQVENAKNEALVEVYCKICSKHFTSRNSYTNHLQSKKHKDLEAKLTKETDEDASSQSKKTIEKQISQSGKQKMEVEQNVDEEKMDDDKHWEDIEENEDIEIDESKGIDLLTCLFCENKSATPEAKVEHMAREHSFYIPDADYVSDLEGLLKFLGVKVGCYHVCLWCSSKCYPTLKAVQQHMFDKGHNKMKFEGDTLYEYADFYTYDENDNYESDSGSEVSEEEAIQDVDRFVEDENYELTLPSGARIGHRSLFRYYKQNFGHRNLELKLRCNYTLRDKYKALGYHGTISNAEIQTKRKDLACFQRWKTKMHMNIGVKSNKLQKHYRRQDIMF